jgi:hypothetical protein
MNVNFVQNGLERITNCELLVIIPFNSSEHKPRLELCLCERFLQCYSPHLHKLFLTLQSITPFAFRTGISIEFFFTSL